MSCERTSEYPPPTAREVRRLLLAVAALALRKRKEARDAVPDTPPHRLIEVRRAIEDVTEQLDELFD